MLHTTGWLEGGLVMSYEKFIMDADQANMIAVLLGGVDLSDNGQAMDALREVGPGSHFLGAQHTLANFESAFYRSTVADNNSFEQWEEEGEQDAAQRANKIWKRMLEEYEPPELDASIDEALQDFMARRKGEFEDRDY
jgi:trimethylamine--corrinoid protein Co-methyltransferase